MSKRLFIIVLDSLGIGELPDAHEYGDTGSHTLKGLSSSSLLYVPNLAQAGLFRIDGQGDIPHRDRQSDSATGAFGRVAEASKGKDTTTGHWEIAGIISQQAMPTYPEGFPPEIIKEFEHLTGHKTICNKPYSGTAVINDYGEEHIETKALIVYTSADSVFQIAAHEDIIPVDLLYDYCRIARKILKGKHAVGRVIARPFTGTNGKFARTENRHDFSLEPVGVTLLDRLSAAGLDVISIGKISDIFAGRGVTEAIPSKNNREGIAAIQSMGERDFNGLCFLNLVDFDMLYGHRNDIDGYANALSEFDFALPNIISLLRSDDLLIITADHGCDPSTPSTDHSREYVPLLVLGNNIKPVNLHTRSTLADISATALEYFNLESGNSGESFLKLVSR